MNNSPKITTNRCEFYNILNKFCVQNAKIAPKSAYFEQFYCSNIQKNRSEPTDKLSKIPEFYQTDKS